MTIELRQPEGWPPVRRYLVFALLTPLLPFALFLSLAAAGSIRWIVSASFTQWGGVLRDVAGLFVIWGAYVFLPVVVLAMFPGLALFRGLFRRIHKRNLLAEMFQVAGLSALVIGFASLGIGLTALIAGEARDLVSFFGSAGSYGLWLVPSAAIMGGLLLRPTGGAR